MTTKKSLDEWLDYIQSVHIADIELGLHRIRLVWKTLNHTITCPVITVAGTNGKGSSVAYLESIYLAAGYTTGVFTSPHLIKYTERITLSGKQVCPDALIETFERIDKARHSIPLTEFEFSALAGLCLFVKSSVDVMILEVGLGGRLDAVNLIDADLALITSLSLDHTDRLGADLTQIAKEKAGIMRPQAITVYGGHTEQQTLQQQADEQQSTLYLIDRDFSYQNNDHSWTWRSSQVTQSDLPLLRLPGEHQQQNASAVIMAVELLQNRLAVPPSSITSGLKNGAPNGRFQMLMYQQRRIILDVAHNEDSAKMLQTCLKSQPITGRTLAVFGILSDKNIHAVIQQLTPIINHWYLASIPTSRGESAENLASLLKQQKVHSKQQTLANSPQKAFDLAILEATPDDQILVFGSFITVSEVMKLLPKEG